ncbi:MAG: hypothetical protein M3Q79_02390 [bacterium]|nr:hypothetical protein [bacterium]
MLKINPALCFRPSDLIEYLKRATDETTIAEEIGAAVTHRLIMEKELGWKDYFIYFEPKDSKQAELLKKIGSTLSYGELEGFLGANAAQDTPMDYAFINKNTQPADVYPVQHKRYFPTKGSTTATSDLIVALEKWRTQYAKTETTLLIHYRGNLMNVDLEEVMRWLNRIDFPFREVIFLIMADDGPTFIQLLPNNGDDLMGYHRYTKSEMLGVT